MSNLTRVMLIILSLTFQLYGSIIHVPSEISSIQAAINSANELDTVLVAEGTYFENIHFRGKKITVASLFIIDEDTNHISKTIIDGSQPQNPDSASVVYINAGLDSTAVICGFTITGGRGTIIKYIDPEFGNSWIRSGGGIFVDSSGAKIENNIISNNSIIRYNYGNGGGIRAWAVPAGKSVIISNNIISNNLIDVRENSGGGGIDIYNITIDKGIYIIRNNVIERNKVIVSSEWKAWGGGIACHVNLPFNGQISIYRNIIRNNILDCESAYGAGIYATFWQQGNIIDDQNKNPVIYNNLIYANQSSDHGSAITVWNSFRHNFPQTDMSPRPFICNNTIANNNGISAFHIYQSTPYIMNNIFKNINSSKSDLYFDAIRSFNGIELHYNFVSDTVNMLKNCTSHNTSDNIFQADPVFTDSVNYYLSEQSPCIDAGHNSSIFNDIEIGGMAVRPAMGTKRNDMGVYGGNPDSIFKYATPIEYHNQQKNYLPEHYVLNQNYPNPFNPSTTITFTLPRPAYTTIMIYNVLGAEVAILASEKLQPGLHKYQLDGRKLASGLYYYQVTSGDFREVKKMILLR